MSQRIYNIIVFTGNKTIGNYGFVKYRKVHRIDRFRDFISKKFPGWVFMNVYDRQTKEKLYTIKKSGHLIST